MVERLVALARAMDQDSTLKTIITKHVCLEQLILLYEFGHHDRLRKVSDQILEAAVDFDLSCRKQGVDITRYFPEEPAPPQAKHYADLVDLSKILRFAWFRACL